MTYLVGDIGGTNTRLALADARGVMTDTLLHAQNDDHSCFDAVLQAFLAKTNPGSLAGVCIAIAGPVHAGTGTLTNRDWALDATQIKAKTKADKAALINDLSALGYALPRISCTPLFGTKQEPTNGQSLVVGMGTGFNVSPTRHSTTGATIAMEAELGHAELPYTVGALLHSELGTAASAFNTVEDCFCGRGLEHLYRVVSGASAATALSGKEIVAAFEAGDTDASRTLRLFARALGRLTQAMIHQYMPRDGIAFAGSASRGVLTSSALHDFTAELTGQSYGIVDPTTVPVSLITNDAAALEGCLQFLVQPT